MYINIILGNIPELSRDRLSLCILLITEGPLLVEVPLGSLLGSTRVSYSCARSQTFGTNFFELNRANSLLEKFIRFKGTGSSSGRGRPLSKSLARLWTICKPGGYLKEHNKN